MRSVQHFKPIYLLKTKCADKIHVVIVVNFYGCVFLNVRHSAVCISASGQKMLACDFLQRNSSPASLVTHASKLHAS